MPTELLEKSAQKLNATNQLVHELDREALTKSARNKVLQIRKKLAELERIFAKELQEETNLFSPRTTGEKIVAQMQKAEGGAFTGTELEQEFSLTSATLHRRRKEHRIVFWRDAKHDFHYPKWQFTATGALLPGVQEVLQIFGSHDEWRLMRYFLGKRQQLGERSPLDLLRAGEINKVLAHARVHAEENTW